MFSVKMHAEINGQHVSGSERIVSENKIQLAVSALVERAWTHQPTSVNLKIERINREIVRVPLVKGCYGPDRDTNEARERLSNILSSLNLDSERILREFYAIRNMRGAVLLDVRTFRHLEPDTSRGVRVSNFDFIDSDFTGEKDHIREAKLLASKVIHGPYIIGEICVTDDVNFTFGYFASIETGLMGVAHIKEPHDSWGGRIILFDSSIGTGTLEEKISECIDYLENQPVIIYEVQR